MKKEPQYPPLNKVKGRITELGLTYNKVSEKTGIPVNTLSNKLNGHSLPNIQEVELLIRALNISPEKIAYYFLPHD